MALTSIHPFPARMAPELAREALNRVPKGGLVLDPMCGSGTVARASVEAGLQCVGSDIDPLAVLMASVWTTPLDTCQIRTDATNLVDTSKSLPDSVVDGTNDPETKRFISYWFGPRQRLELARLATALRRHRKPTGDALAVALSRIIVSKEMMASLARDTSHSRPHRVASANDFDVYSGFLRSASQLAERLQPNLIKGQAHIRIGDARVLDGLDDSSVDIVVTSPPYLNAIDYLRGHRLALVWFGYKLRPLREIRSANVGAERSIDPESTPIDISLYVNQRTNFPMGNRHLGWIRRYALDMNAVLQQIRRVIKRGGLVVLVVGNSFLRGATIDNASLIGALAAGLGFRLKSRQVRDIPARRRYLPPPGDRKNALDVRIRTEAVLSFGLD